VERWGWFLGLVVDVRVALVAPSWVIVDFAPEEQGPRNQPATDTESNLESFKQKWRSLFKVN
jgi:hypothetical protein